MYLRLSMLLIAYNDLLTLIFRCKCCLNCHPGIGCDLSSIKCLEFSIGSVCLLGNLSRLDLFISSSIWEERNPHFLLHKTKLYLGPNKLSVYLGRSNSLEL